MSDIKNPSKLAAEAMGDCQEIAPLGDYSVSSSGTSLRVALCAETARAVGIEPGTEMAAAYHPPTGAFVFVPWFFFDGWE